jgi:hypothetical protein
LKKQFHGTQFPAQFRTHLTDYFFWFSFVFVSSSSSALLTLPSPCNAFARLPRKNFLQGFAKSPGTKTQKSIIAKMFFKLFLSLSCSIRELLSCNFLFIAIFGVRAAWNVDGLRERDGEQIGECAIFNRRSRNCISESFPSSQACKNFPFSKTVL